MGIGFWKGKIEMKLERFSFHPGETIKGEISYKLKKPTKAREITIRLIGEERQTNRRVRSEGGVQTETRKVKFFDLKIPLDGEKEYSEGQYDFKVPIPKGLYDPGKRPEGMIGDILGALETMSGSRRDLEWTLIANLDIPMGFDLSKKQKIVID